MTTTFNAVAVNTVLKLKDTVNGFSTSLASPALAANRTWTLPSTYPAGSYALISDTNGNLTASQLSLTSGVTGTLPVGSGGTGLTTITVNGVVYGNGTSPAGVTSAGVQYQSLIAGPSGVPAFNAVALDQLASTSGTLPIARGGTGVTTVPTNGQLLIGNGSGYTVASPTGDANVIVTAGSGTLAFSLANTISSNTSGNAATATILQTARNINGVSFNGSADITVTAAAGTLTGTTLNSTVVSSSLTSVGTIASGVWNGTAVGATYGGTGLTAYNVGDVLYCATSNTLTTLPRPSVTSVLQNTSAGAVTWLDKSQIDTGLIVHEAVQYATTQNISSQTTVQTTQASFSNNNVITTVDLPAWPIGTRLSSPANIYAGTYIVSGPTGTGPYTWVMSSIAFTSATAQTVDGTNGYFTTNVGSGAIVTGSTSLTTVTAPSWVVGTLLSGSGIATGAYIVSGSGNSWVMSAPATATGTINIDGGTGFFTNINLSSASNFDLAQATFTGAVSGGTTLTVTGLSSGTILIGQAIYSASTTNSPVITAFVSGVSGGNGVYTISPASANFSAEAMTSSWRPVAGNRLLIKNQTDLKQNGLYQVLNSYSISRAIDNDGTPSAEITSGDYVLVMKGSNYINTGWVLQGAGTKVPNTDNMVWAQFSSVGSIQPGAGISITGSTVSTDNTPNGGITNGGGNHLDFSGTNSAIVGNLPANHGGTGFGSYAVGDLLYANTTSTFAKLAAATTGNVLKSAGTNTAPVYGQVALTTDVSGTLPLTNGGTGSSSLATQYGVVYATSTTAYGYTSAGTTGLPLLANTGSGPAFGQLNISSGTNVTGVLAVANGGTSVSALTDRAVVIGRGTAAVEFAAPGTAGIPLVSTGASTNPAFGALDLDVAGATTGTLGVARGGTNLASLTQYGVFIGQGTADPTFASPSTAGLALVSTGATSSPSFGAIDLDATGVVTGTLAVASGGTNLASYTTGDILYASGSTTLASLADVATGNVILSGGVGVAPSYGKVGLTTHVSGVLPIANGGTNASSVTPYGVQFANSAGSAISSLTPISYKTLVQGTAAGNPAWSNAIYASSVMDPSNPNDTVVTLTGVGSVANYLDITNAVATANPKLTAVGADTNIGLDLQAKGTGTYRFLGTADQGAELRLFEDTDNGSNYARVKVPDALAGNTLFQLPATNGTNGYVLKTDGSGVTSWTNPAAVATPDTISIVPQQVDVDNTSYVTVGYFSYRQPTYPSITSISIAYEVETVTSTLSIRLYDLTAAAAVVGATAQSTGFNIHTTTSIPAASGRWALQVLKSAGAGANPQIYGVQLIFNA